MTDPGLLKDAAFALGLLSSIFAFYWRFIRPGLVRAVEWRKDVEGRVAAIAKDVERRTKDDGAMLECMRGMRDELAAIKTQIAVLEERSKAWGARA